MKIPRYFWPIGFCNKCRDIKLKKNLNYSFCLWKMKEDVLCDECQTKDDEAVKAAIKSSMDYISITKDNVEFLRYK